MHGDEVNFDEINKKVRYEDGNLYWKVQNRGRTKIGEKAGTSTNGKYHTITLYGKGYYVHRIIFFMHHGFMPVTVDHINGNRLDNRIENLRAATRSQNSANQKTPNDNTTGERNVYRNKEINRWQVKLQFKGKLYKAGHFKEYDDAVIAARELRAKIFGEFANER